MLFHAPLRPPPPPPPCLLHRVVYRRRRRRRGIRAPPSKLALQQHFFRQCGRRGPLPPARRPRPQQPKVRRRGVGRGRVRGRQGPAACAFGGPKLAAFHSTPKSLQRSISAGWTAPPPARKNRDWARGRSIRLQIFWLGRSREPDGAGHTPLPDMGPGHRLDA